MRGQGYIFRRGNVYWCSFYLNGTEMRESTKQTDEKKAETYLKNRLDAAGAARRGSESFTTSAMQRVTIRELLEALQADFQQRGKASAQNLSGIKQATEAFGDFRAMQFKPKHVNVYIVDQLAEGYANASINRILGLVEQAFGLAIREERLSASPYIKRLPEINARSGFCDSSTFQKIYDNLPADLADFAQFAFSSGWRKKEIGKLTWDNVDGNMIRIRGDQTKNKDARCVPITGKLVDVLKRRGAARSFEVNGHTQMCNLVFHRDGRAITEFRKSWASACRKAGKPGLLFHDLRRSFAVASVQAGIPQLITMSIGGWRTASMFRRYAIVAESEMQTAMERVESYQAEQAKRAEQGNVRAMSK